MIRFVVRMVCEVGMMMVLVFDSSFVLIVVGVLMIDRMIMFLSFSFVVSLFVCGCGMVMMMVVIFWILRELLRVWCCWLLL